MSEQKNCTVCGIFFEDWANTVPCPLCAAREELAEHPVHEACPKCRQKMEYLRNRAEKAEAKLDALRLTVWEHRKELAELLETLVDVALVSNANERLFCWPRRKAVKKPARNE